MTCFIYIFSLTNRIQKGNSLHTAMEDQSRAINPIVIKPASLFPILNAGP